MWKELDRVPVPQSSSVMHERLLATVAEIKRRPRMPYILKPIFLLVTAVSAALYMGHSLELRSPEPDHFRGESTATVTLLEYGDYACPCAFYNTMVNDVLSRYPGKVRLEFRHFPLQRHMNAQKAAIAAEAAGEQGHFWEMHDLLFLSQDDWKSEENPEKQFAVLAKRIGIDSDRLVQAMQKPSLRERVMKDIAIGQAANIQAVPTFFINGERVPEPPQTEEGFAALIDSQLGKKK